MEECGTIQLQGSRFKVNLTYTTAVMPIPASHGFGESIGRTPFLDDHFGVHITLHGYETTCLYSVIFLK